MNSRKKLILIIAVAVFILGIFFIPKITAEIEWKIAARAAGSLPYQIGLTNAVIIKCFTTGTPPICTGGTLCSLKDAGSCTLYSEVSGTPAGGMGQNALFQQTAISMAGLTPGGQLIAGGMSPVLMDNGVLASAGGCYGCMAKSESLFGNIASIFKVIIAGFGGN